MDRHRILATARRSLDDGRLAARCGDLAGAIDRSGDVVARLVRLKRTSRPESWSVRDEKLLVEAYFLRANSLAGTGEIRGALRDLTSAESILTAVREGTDDGRWTRDDEVHLASVYMRRGDVHVMNDESEPAVRDYNTSISLLETLKTDGQRAGWTDDNDVRLAIAYFSRGNFRDTGGNAAGAIHDLDRAVSILRSLKERAAGDSDEFMLSLASAYVSRGRVRAKRDDLERAIADYDAARNFIQGMNDRLPPRGGLHPIRLTLANILNQRGKVLVEAAEQGRAVGDTHAAVRNFDEAISILKSVGRQGTRQRLLPHLEILEECYLYRCRANLLNGACLAAGEDFAVARTVHGDDLFSTDPFRTVPRWKEDRFRVYGEMLDLLRGLGGPVSGWAQTTSRRMAVEMELLAPVDADRHAAELRRLFSLFHGLWLKHGIESDLESIPQIVLAVQGRELARQVLHELEAETELPEDVAAYRALRLAMRERARRIQELLGNAGAWGAGAVPRLGVADRRRDLGEDDEIASLVEAYREDYGRLPAARTAAAAHEGYEVLLQPYESISVERIQEVLEPEEVLMLLIDRVPGDRGAPGALVVGKDGAPSWIDLAGLDDVLVEVQKLEQACSGTRGFRGAGRGPVNEKTGAESRAQAMSHFWRDMEISMALRLWERLEGACSTARRVVFVTHGRLHMLPLSAGKPQRLDMVMYPGLIYFVLQRGRRSESQGRFGVDLDVGLRSCAGTPGHARIPMVECECRAVEDLFLLAGTSPRVAYPLDFEKFEGNVELLFFSCHGGPDPNHPFSIALHIGPGQLLDIHRIHGSGLRARYVYMSACLGGVMKEDWDGNPMGLYAGFWLRGTRVVVASIVPVPDEWMPILSVLTMQSLLRDGLPLQAALAEGKRRLRSGDWYGDSTADVADGTETLLRRHVFPEIRRHYLLPRLDRPTYIRESAAGRNIVTGLCARYSVDAERAENLADLYRRTVAVDAVMDVISGISDVCVESWLQRRIPPEPALGTMMYGVCALGEA